MKKLSYLNLFFLLLVTFQVQASAATNLESFTLGESLTYRIHYGWLDAGIATMKVDRQFHEVHGQTCYKIDVAGESKGLLYLFLKAKNEFGSYLDSTALISQASYRYIQEGKYRKSERVSFNHPQKLAIVERLATDGDTEPPLDTVAFPICDQIQDMVSNWYVLRTRDFSQVPVGQIFSNPIFFDDILYQDFQTKFLGRTRIKTKLGYINALVLAPLVPFTSNGSSIFAGENSVELFLSDDENKIPLKIKIKLIVGAIEMELIQHQGLKHELKLAKAK
jgi:hypothetical protein